MTDRVSLEQRSRMMAAVRGADTSPELYVRKKLFAEGFRYRLYAKELVGKPDIVLPRFRLAVFVHGCFWHGHSCSRGKRPTSNVEFWNVKIDGNMRRDRHKPVCFTGGRVVRSGDLGVPLEKSHRGSSKTAKNA
jgi:DNA mismatch endonuclease, patch repair protein